MQQHLLLAAIMVHVCMHHSVCAGSSTLMFGRGLYCFPGAIRCSSVMVNDMCDGIAAP